MAETFISALMLLRKKAGLTQQELATHIGVTPSAVAFWEQGRREPNLTIRQVKLLCEALGVSLQDLPDSFAPQPIHSSLVEADEQ